MTEPLAAEPPTQIIQGCRDTDGCCPGGPEACRLDAARAEATADRLKQKPVTLLYAHSDGQTFSYVDQFGGVPTSGRERALLRGLLNYALSQLDQYEMSGGMIAVAHD